jgi:hypothetical protein
MKKWLLVGALALGGLALTGDRAAAQCFDLYRPCVHLPLFRVPVYVPKVRFFCECSHTGCKDGSCFGGGPWYMQYPGSLAGGYQYGAFGAFNGPTGFGHAAQAAAPHGGFGGTYAFHSPYGTGGWGSYPGWGAPAYWSGR